MRSVVVVLPASMCAMIPMFRQRFRGTVRATVSYLSLCKAAPCGHSNSVQTGWANSPPCSLNSALPAVVGEGLVGLGHAMNVFLLLHRGTATIRGVQQL